MTRAGVLSSAGLPDNDNNTAMRSNVSSLLGDHDQFAQGPLFSRCAHDGAGNQSEMSLLVLVPPSLSEHFFPSTCTAPLRLRRVLANGLVPGRVKR